MNLEEKIKSIILDLMEKMGVEGDVEVKKVDDNYHALVNGDDVSILVGYRGEVLDSIQHILNLMLRTEEGFTRVILDVDNYREGRNKSLEELAKNTADKVRFTGKSIELAPMSSYERRVIHVVIGEQEGVESESTDTGDMRRVVISPAGKGESQENS